MSRKKMVAGLVLAALVVLVAAGGAVWYVFLRDDAPEEVTLASALESLSPAASGASSAAASATTAASGGATTAADGLSGDWKVDTSVGSFAGYRVKEELVGTGFTTAVGRTSDVTGSFLVEGNTVKSGSVEAKLSALKSDQSMRDNALRQQALETGKFPTATFKLTSPVTLPATLISGQALTTTLVGELTLHGVTRPVEIPIETTISGDHLVIVGSLDIVFADYGIARPNAQRVLSVEDHGVMELQLFFKR